MCIVCWNTFLNAEKISTVCAGVHVGVLMQMSVWSVIIVSLEIKHCMAGKICLIFTLIM